MNIKFALVALLAFIITVTCSAHEKRFKRQFFGKQTAVNYQENKFTTNREYEADMKSVNSFFGNSNPFSVFGSGFALGNSNNNFNNKFNNRFNMFSPQPARPNFGVPPLRSPASGYQPSHTWGYAGAPAYAPLSPSNRDYDYQRSNQINNQYYQYGPTRRYPQSSWPFRSGSSFGSFFN